jgi:hypothetical protein
MATILGFGRPSSIVEFPFDTARNITNGLSCLPRILSSRGTPANGP